MNFTFLYHVVRNIKKSVEMKINLLRVMAFLPKSSKVAGSAMFLGNIDKRKINIGAKTLIEDNVVITVGNREHEHVEIGNDCRIRSGAQIHTWGGHLTIGDCSSINANCVLYGTGGISIGSYVRIAANCVIVSSSHTFEALAVPIHDQGFSATGITINDNVWIGANVTILDGVTIGAGSIVGAGSVVRKDIAPNTIVAGVPAKFIKARHAD